MTKTTEAIKWIEAVNAGNGLANVWRLEILEKRLKTKKGEIIPEEKQPPFKIRRFLKGVPAGYIVEVIKYLHSTSPYEGIIFNGEKLEGKWRLTRTTWRRDEQTVIDRGQMNQGTYTLVQDLTEESEAADSLDTLSESSCSVEQTSTYVWDAPDVEDIEIGKQGETWSIRNVGRNDDGTYNYVKVHTRALTQHAGEVVANKNAYETVYTDSWNNVYGIPPDFRDDGDNKITLPEESENVKFQISENDDCTYRISMERREPVKSNESELSCEKTQFEHDDAVTTRAQEDGLGEAPEASGGRITSHKSELREDGKFDNTVRTKQEKEVKNSEEQWSVGLTGVVHKVTDTQTASPAAKPEFSRSNIGKVVSNTKTPGGLYNVVTTEVDRKGDPLDTGEECGTTVFEHSHSTTVSDPSGNILAGHTEPAGGGKTYQVTSRLNDDGTATTVTRETEELSQPGARVEYRKTIRGLAVSVTDRNSDTAVNDSGMKIGETRSSELTPGGLYNNTVTTVSAQDVGDTGSNCSQTIFEHSHETTTNQSSKPGTEASAAGGGKTHQTVSRLTDEGTWDVTTRTVTENSVPSSTVVKKKTLRGVVVTVTDSHTTNDDTEVRKVGEEVRVEKTPGGLFNRTQTSVESTPAGLVSVGCETTIFSHTDETTVNQESSGGEATAAGDGKTYQKTSRQTEEGTWDVSERVVSEQSVPRARASKKITTHALTTVVINANGEDSSMSNVSKTTQPGNEIQVEKTPGGRFTKHEVIVEPTDFKTWDAVVSLDMMYRKTMWFINATQSQYKAVISQLSDECNSKIRSWKSQDREPSDYTVSPTVNLNEVGLFDGNVTFSATWSPGSAGQEGVVDEIISDHTIQTSWIDTEDGKGQYGGGINRGVYIRNVQGRGKAKYRSLLSTLAPPDAADIQSSSSYSPSTGLWNFTLKWTIHRDPLPEKK